MNSTTSPIGLTKREHFAALILAGLCANLDITSAEIPLDGMSTMAINQADSLIEKLNDGPKSSDPEDLASEARWQEDKALDDFNHREFYRPLYSTEFVKVSDHTDHLDYLQHFDPA